MVALCRQISSQSDADKELKSLMIDFRLLQDADAQGAEDSARVGISEAIKMFVHHDDHTSAAEDGGEWSTRQVSNVVLMMCQLLDGTIANMRLHLNAMRKMSIGESSLNNFSTCARVAAFPVSRSQIWHLSDNH